MIRYLRYAFLGLLAIVLLTVALANRGAVEVALLPPGLSALLGLDWRMQLPLFLVIFGGIAAGLLIGFFWEWAREMKHRSAASQQEILKKHDDPETLNATKARQTAHIEGNLESILGAQFAEYQLKKAAIVAHLAGVKKNP